MSDCLFCKIVAGEIPSNKVYEDEQCFAFYDIDPQAPTHFLVIPKAHIASAAEVTAENSGVVAHIFEVIAKVARELGLDSYRIVSNIGEQAGQSVKHLHFHVLSGRDMTWHSGPREEPRDRGGSCRRKGPEAAVHSQPRPLFREYPTENSCKREAFPL